MATPMRSTDFRSVVEPILNEVFDGVYEQRACLLYTSDAADE